VDGGPLLVSASRQSGQTLDVLFTPADFGALARRDLSQMTCAVFDVLRATTSLLTALAAGAKAVIPAADIPEALVWKARLPHALLAGEREGRRILRDLTGTVDFDFGNSPREFTAERVAGRTLIATTTNGTRALRACVGARAVLAASLRNAAAVADWISANPSKECVLVCSGTYEDSSYEDVLGAGAVVDRLWERLHGVEVLDGARMARLIYLAARSDLVGAMADHARNGRRLRSLPDLAPDLAVCASEDDLCFVGRLGSDGAIRIPDGDCAVS